MILAAVAVGVVILCLLAVSAVFSAAETALTRASRGRLHQLEREGDAGARRVNRLLSDQETMIGAVLIGYNVLNILCSALATEFFTRLAPGAEGVVLATGFMTVLVVVFVEVLPKTLAIVHADDVARAVSGPVLVVVRALGPVLQGVQWIVRLTLGLFGVRLDGEADASAAHDEIRGAVNYHHAEGAVESEDRRMLGGVLDLSEMDVGELMVHRRAMVMIDVDLSPREIVQAAMQAEHTRLPLYRGEPENIVGVLHAKDLLRALAEAEGRMDALDIPAIAREPWFIPETTSARDQLDAFRKRRNHFALVVDEYGALEGLVTLEDILEEIVGDIDDEHDEAIEGVRREADGSVNVDGGVTVRDLNRYMDWTLPDEHAVTVAGLLIHEARALPDVGQSFVFHQHRFEVLGRERNQITALRIGPRLPGLDES